VATKFTQSFKDLSLTFKKHPVTDDLVVTKDAAAIQQALTTLLLTSKGERLFQPEMGSSLRRFLFEPLDYATASLIKSAILETIKEYEPRVIVIELIIDPNRNEDGFDVEMTYKIIGLQQPPVTVDFFLSRTR
tara:strand:- start:329 stop:727 length:399 start_codon:yes stop_codon:yes gene_type:complete